LKLRPEFVHEKYKTKLCKSFHASNYCPYGLRCIFIHLSKNRLEESFIYRKLNNIKSDNPNELMTHYPKDRLHIFKVICKSDSEHDTESYDLESMSTNDEREKNVEDGCSLD